jgi:hypothetical protein
VAVLLLIICLNFNTILITRGRQFKYHCHTSTKTSHKIILIRRLSPPPPILRIPPRKAMVAERCMNWKNNNGFKSTIMTLDKRLAAGGGQGLQDVRTQANKTQTFFLN